MFCLIPLYITPFSISQVPKPPVAPVAAKLKIVDYIVGKGLPVVNGDEVTVDYTGTLTNGTEFDSSLKPGRTPFVFVVGTHQVITGWEKGLLGMKVGGKRKLVIPPDMGYGPGGQGPIPPNSTLVFVIELHKIKTQKEAAAEKIASDLKLKSEMNIKTVTPGTGDPAKFGDSLLADVDITDATGKVVQSTSTLGGPQDIPLNEKVPNWVLVGLTNVKLGEIRTFELKGSYIGIAAKTPADDKEFLFKFNIHGINGKLVPGYVRPPAPKVPAEGTSAPTTPPTNPPKGGGK